MTLKQIFCIADGQSFILTNNLSTISYIRNLTWSVPKWPKATSALFSILQKKVRDKFETFYHNQISFRDSE